MYSLLKTKMLIFKLTVSVIFFFKKGNKFLNIEHTAKITCIFCGCLIGDKIQISLQYFWDEIAERQTINGEFF